MFHFCCMIIPFCWMFRVCAGYCTGYRTGVCALVCAGYHTGRYRTGVCWILHWCVLDIALVYAGYHTGGYRTGVCWISHWCMLDIALVYAGYHTGGYRTGVCWISHWCMLDIALVYAGYHTGVCCILHWWISHWCMLDIALVDIALSCIVEGRGSRVSHDSCLTSPQYMPELCPPSLPPSPSLPSEAPGLSCIVEGRGKSTTDQICCSLTSLQYMTSHTHKTSSLNNTADQTCTRTRTHTLDCAPTEATCSGNKAHTLLAVHPLRLPAVATRHTHS